MRLLALVVAAGLVPVAVQSVAASPPAAPEGAPRLLNKVEPGSSAIPATAAKEGGNAAGVAAKPTVPAGTTTPAAASGADAPTTRAETAKPAPKPPAPPTLVARIDLSSQRMTVITNGKTLHTWPISSGAAGYHTPTGTFRPTRTEEMWYSTQYDDAPMPHSVFFNGGIATHGTYATRRLGSPASHGCVRLAPRNAERFYDLVRQHGLRRTRVIVAGKTPVTAPAVARGPSRRRHAEREEDNWRDRAGRRPVRRYYYMERYGYAPPRPYYDGYGGYGRPRLVYPGDRW
ncbi:MAG: L,D-transpeptidase family protein [Hyphomicrobiaceae bacterium]